MPFNWRQNIEQLGVVWLGQAGDTGELSLRTPTPWGSAGHQDWAPSELVFPERFCCRESLKLWASSCDVSDFQQSQLSTGLALGFPVLKPRSTEWLHLRLHIQLCTDLLDPLLSPQTTSALPTPPPFTSQNMTSLELTAYISRTFLFLPLDLGKLYLLTFLTFTASLLLRNPPLSPLILAPPFLTQCTPCCQKRPGHMSSL